MSSPIRMIGRYRGQDGSVAVTLGQARNNSRWDTTRGIHPARYRLKPTARGIGYVDGAWWPYSDDLMTQLPDLIAVLSMRLGAISCVMYNNTEWRMTPTELVSGGRVVQLDGHRRHPFNTVEVLDSKAISLACWLSHLTSTPIKRTGL
jgi:hypothetical protein